MLDSDHIFSLWNSEANVRAVFMYVKVFRALICHCNSFSRVLYAGGVIELFIDEAVRISKRICVFMSGAGAINLLFCQSVVLFHPFF